MAPRVMTVSGPIPPDRLGFTLPHEHTGIYLWHIEKRWDYWELTPDEDLITDELRDFRRRGGATLVDLTLDGVGRDPGRLRRLAGATGLNIVMGTGWYRGAHYPAEALDRPPLRRRPGGGDRRRVQRWRRRERHPARDHRRDRHRQAVGQRARGARASGGGARIGPDRDGDHDARRAVGRRAGAAQDLHRGGRRSLARRHRSRGLPPGPRLLPRRARRRREPPVRLPQPSVRRRGGPGAAAGRDDRRAAGARIRVAAAARPRTCATTGCSRHTAASATSTCTSTFSRRSAPPRWGRARSRR